ncbi:MULTISPECIES: NAD kinase [unclassified Lactobacillus]|uniref:NAD kinase n=1 Tax=unclassified Lactobacillus TaxID=2620435 RepID=UPI000EFB3AF3|nr:MULTISPECIES: NAD kinase [unclassified Lactobacillus]RMC40756.1 NAD kinase [Lactobacillus sp. ESL0237]RMC44512.1 NAD kinase [Lactobacillus sp. ESL0234]RMC45819.1 NAD kinase [Lactobacillus sp. ESL0236]RMC46156.1 NAD kinase [Lactobacillus sp. ESL0230]RMC51209.1 NAD kinase [Lactobacillus sp. ESL0225]
MRIAIAHNNNDETLQVVARLKSLLATKNDVVFDAKYPDVVITVGGDGTLINAFHRYESQISSIRFIGIHTGHLGFYTDWRSVDVDKMVDALFLREPESAKYPLLEVELVTEAGDTKHYLALNESAVKRISHTLEANIYIDDQLFENFRGDGLCISTPTGSTGYNKSLGGAVIHPQLKALQMAEIASINNRVFRTLSSPIVIAPEQWITIVPKADHFVMTIDGSQINVRNAKKINYRISNKVIRFDRFGHTYFWTRVQNAFIGDKDDDF